MECWRERYMWTVDSRTRGGVAHATNIWEKFLQWEYTQRHGGVGFEVQGVYQRVPQQENDGDCGVYVLETIERVMRFVGQGRGAPRCIAEPFTTDMAALKRAQILSTFQQYAHGRQSAEPPPSQPHSPLHQDRATTATPIRPPSPPAIRYRTTASQATQLVATPDSIFVTMTTKHHTATCGCTTTQHQARSP
ncbi:PREDICTED: uncharacterized protein LOC108357935 [Rhagoletis zephyria]|uniref:uncharacterized protein LOC108357935 n=1 Tax=Rhagoletis zephyria TaxID=28612 RepID=UPI0008119A96|nr:PREDICTED: uncharacterized protein LOC108357935 [Rhagoletis zephyria]